MSLSIWQKLFLTISVFLFSHILSAQILVDDSWGKGLNFAARDSSFSLKLGFRFQTLYEGIAVSGDYRDKLLTRRSRLKFDGFAFNENIVYKVELAISNRDHRSGQIIESGNTANIVLDAAVKWNFSGNWQLWFGQTKLPGNRERVISSQKLQFVDRSLVNSRFTLDRDLGIQLRHSKKTGAGVINQMYAISMGEGRNIIVSNPGGGYQWTGRIEYLPFGKFSSKGDYFGSDLKRESTPKLSLGFTGDYNDNATRARVNLGSFILDAEGNYVTNDISTVMADLMFKYRGYSLAAEYANRVSSKDSNNQFGTGRGYVVQSGYLFNSNWEVAARYTDITAYSQSSLVDRTEYTFGISKYVVGHSLKMQTDVSLQQSEGPDRFIYRLQVEIAL